MPALNSRCFIYFRHTPKRIKFFASYDLSSIGVPKRIIKDNDPNGPAVKFVMDRMVEVARHMGRKVDWKTVITAIKPLCVGKYNIEDILYCPQQGKFGERIYIGFVANEK